MRRVVVPLVCVLVCGCSQPDALVSVPQLEAAQREPATVPTTRDDFLRLLSPLPSEALVIVYSVEGPAGMRGTAELIARHGGYERQNWVVDVGEARIEGSNIRTPDMQWSQGVEGTAIRSPVILGRLADAFEEASSDVKADVVAAVQGFHAALDRGRSARPGPQREVAGETCLVTKVALSELCVWEPAGLPLSYRSDAFVVEATHIDRSPDIGETAFVVPPGQWRPEDAEAFDARAALQQLARGEVAELTRWLQPSLQLPPVG